ncbi:MAG: hypothetical protein Q8P62_04140 [Candidatus Peregrinibacteria bacterium]|nr:hypothetical protein [Candidatus Peregrinibacteria bacterium]
MALSNIKKAGISIVEVVLAAGIFAIFSTSIFYLSIDSLQGSEKIEENNKAILYAQEGIEATRQMRDRNYLLLEPGDHGLDMTNDTWSFIQAPEDIDGYYNRTIFISDVFRDENGNISDAGTLDSDIKEVTSKIEWLYRGLLPRSLELTTYLADWRGNDIIQTDCTEFNSGTLTDTETISTLAPPEDNCAIKLLLEESQSEFLVSADVGEHGNDVVVDGNYAYVSTEKTNGGLAVVDITNRQAPVVVQTIDIGEKGNSVTKIGNYVYVGTGKSSKGLAVINATLPASATLLTTKDIGGEGISIASSGNYLYMGIDGSSPKFVVLDVSNPASPTVSSSSASPGEIYGIDIAGGYAYVGMDYDWQGFRIYNISNPASPTVVSNLGLNEEVNVVKVQGPYAFLGTEANSFYVIDVSNPALPSVTKKITTAAEIQDITIQGDYAYVAMNTNSQNLSAINISTPANPYVVYTKDLGGKGSGITSDANYIYETIIVNNKGLVINGTTVLETADAGDYVSTPFDTGSSDPRYNYLKWVAEATIGSTVKLQIRTADTEVGLADAMWVGSDGTAGTYYENSGMQIVVSPSASGTRYIQFKIQITSDGVHTPLIESVTINYNP